MSLSLSLINRGQECRTEVVAWTSLVFNHLYTFADISAAFTPVSLAVFRCITVCLPQQAKAMCTKPRAKLTIMIVLIISFLYGSTYLFSVRVINLVDWGQPLCYRHILTDVVRNHPIYHFWFFWAAKIMTVMLVVLLVTFTIPLVIVILKAKRRNNRLHNNQDKGTSNHIQTTMMLVTVLIITFATQMTTMAIYAIDMLFIKLHPVLVRRFDDVLFLIDKIANFTIYCFMSKKYRYTLKSLFKIRKVAQTTESTLTK